jgi:uncharacterized lipoprotein
MNKAVAGLAALVLLAACSSSRPFYGVVGDVRVSGDVSENLFASKAAILDVQLYDASTGYPVDASAVAVKAGSAPIVQASREQLGSFQANVPSDRHIDLYITTRDNRSLYMTLQQQ